MTNDDRRKELKDINQKRIDLGELVVKLGGFVGESESVKKAVIYAIIAVFNNNPDLKNDLNDVYSSHVTNLSESDKSAVQAVGTGVIEKLKNEVSRKITETERLIESLNKHPNNSPSSPSSSADPDKLQSKLDALRKVNELCGFYDNVSKSQNDPTNILTNLCTGLEKFLGFNKESKGYDGTGIVYSDLDRLCDAVMGFLSGVLGAVKNADEVITYDKNTTKIGDVINTLQSSIGTGRTGLAASVTQVKEWLEGYDGDVGKKTEKINKQFNNVTDIINKEMDNFTVLQNESLTYQLTHSEGVTKELVDISENAKNLVNDLDQELQKKIQTPVTVINRAVKLLHESAKNNDLIKQAKKVDEELGKQRRKLDNQINDETRKLNKKLDVEFEKMWREIKILNQTRWTQIKSINETVNGAKQYLVQLNDDHKTDITNRFKEIHTALNDVNSKNPTDNSASDGMSALHKNYLGIRKQIVNIRESLERYMNDLGRWINESSTLVDNAMIGAAEIEEMKPGFEYQAKLTKVGRELGDWKHRVEDHIEGVKKELKAKVADVRTTIAKLYDVVRDGQEGEGNDKNRLADVFGKIKHDVDTIKGNGSGGLQAIDTAVEVYASTFLIKFEVALQNVVVKIVEGDGVKGCIALYVSSNRRLHSQLHDDKVKWFLTQYIQSYVASLVRQAANTINLSFTTDLNELANKLQLLGEKVETHLTQTGMMEQTVAEAIKVIENNKVLNINHRMAYDNANLQQALRIIIPALHSAVKGAAAEISRFIFESKISNLKISSDTAKKLEAKLRIAFDNYMSTESPAAKVDVAVDNITTYAETIDFTPTISKLKSWSDDIKSRVSEITTAFSGVAENVKQKMLEIRDFNIKRDLIEIKLAIEDLQATKFKNLINDANNNILERIKALEKVPGGVEQRQQEVEAIMEHLKTKIDEHLQTISLAVTIADDAMKHCVQRLRTVLKECHERNKDAVEILRCQLLADVQTAFAHVTTEIQKLFADSHKADLIALRNLVKEQLEEVKRIIATDKVTGLKGLLCLFNKKLPLLNHTYFPSLVSRFQHLYDQTHRYVKCQLDGVDDADPDSQPETPHPLAALLVGLTGKVDKLLSKLELSGHFNYEFRENLDALECALQTFTPSKFGGPCTVLLDVVKGGVQRLAGELDKAYVSTYDSQKYVELIKIHKHKVGNKGVEETYDLTEEGTNCAKLFFTMTSIISDAVSAMRSSCVMTWREMKLNLDGKNSPLGLCFQNAGFAVSKSDTVHNGELRNRMSGQKVNEKLKTMNGTANVKHVSEWKAAKYHNSGENVTLLDILDYLQYCLETYYQVRHISTFTSKKRPCSIYEMLCWLSGMPCNNAYYELLGDGLSDPLKDARKQTKEVDGESEFTVEKPESLYLDASPKTIKYDNTVDVVRHLCSISHDLLTTLLGHGDAETTYAVDFSSNAMNLHYPQKGEDCLQMLLDILCRLLPQLRYLHEKCKLSTDHGGWYSCKYGKDIKTSKWPCTDHSSDEPNDKATCQPKSPLQSYLNDCLPGHLPHQVESIGCNAVCKTCPKSTPGMPCLTPLGFRGFSGSTKKGKDICSVLTKFLANEHMSCLFALSVKPPRTLPEHFGFTLSLVNGWHVSRPNGLRNALQDAFENDIGKQSIGLVNKRGSLSDALREAYGKSQDGHAKHEDKSADLSSLSMSTACAGKLCAPYISTSCLDIYNYLPYKHANLYLSWAIYLPWTFWDLLNNLYNAFCSINCQDWGCRGCLRGDKCKKGEHGVVDVDKPSSICQCRSIVDCKGVAPTLYQYGFVFGEASTLNDKTSPKKCSDFCSQLKNVLKSEYFKKLFKECDNFLWKIREPFSYLVLALWLLSFLYLIHILIIRMDLLHIKSHLHSPSSHRIAAQSLLAAARVNKLGRVFYLQP